jgi:hypothetical protein
VYAAPLTGGGVNMRASSVLLVLLLSLAADVPLSVTCDQTGTATNSANAK